MSELINREAVFDALKDMYHAAKKWREEASDDVIKARAESCMTSLVEMKLRIENLPSAQSEEDCLKCVFRGFPGFKQFQTAQPENEQPTIKEREMEWIPVSKRVPNENKYYLTTTVNGEVYCDRWIEDNFDRTELVIAWMPLPEPYKEVDDDYSE